MDYDEFLNWLNSYSKFGIKLDLERIKYLCEKLKDPQNDYKTIHVAGTNGKGSISKYIGSILISAGYKTGIYTSPHLERFSERIIIDNKEISDKDLIDISKKIKPIVSEMQKKNINPTYFEIVTAISFLYFSIKKVDIAVIEVGLGGRFDATNIINPMASVVSNISLEHCDRLGESIEKISFEKAGIIKEKIPIISSAKNNSLKVIKKISSEKKSKLTIINDKNWKRTSFNTKFQSFEISIFEKKYNVETNILGKYQGENIAVSIATVLELVDLGFKITKENIIKGIAKTKNPGRMEILSNNPLILLDGAHNLEAIKKLKQSLKKDFEYNRLILVLGILEDKKYLEMLEEIIPICDKIITTKSKNKRSIDPFKLKKEIEYIDYKKPTVVMKTVEKAVLHAKQEAGIKDLICFCGSLFLIGEARAFFKELSLF